MLKFVVLCIVSFSYLLGSCQQVGVLPRSTESEIIWLAGFFVLKANGYNAEIPSDRVSLFREFVGVHSFTGEGGELLTESYPHLYVLRCLVGDDMWGIEFSCKKPLATDEAGRLIPTSFESAEFGRLLVWRTEEDGKINRVVTFPTGSQDQERVHEEEKETSQSKVKE